MKKTVFLAGIVLVLGLAFVACEMLNGDDELTNGDNRLPALGGSVTITGTAIVGRELSVNIDNLGGTGTVTYQWRRGTAGIVIGTGPTYVIQNADVNSTITVTVTRAGFSGYVTSPPTAIVITPGSPAPDADEVEAEGGTLADRLAWLRDNAEDGKWHIVRVNGNENIGPQELAFGDKTVGVILRGNGAIGLTQNGSLFTVGSGATLRLDGEITLQGRSANSAPLVFVGLGGTLITEEGSGITGNNNTVSPGGGGVRVDGAFTMNGGEVSHNSASGGAGWLGGGGVFVHMGGVFEMEAGTVRNNTANNSGGVHVGLFGIFTMRGGEILDNASGSAAGGVMVHGGFDMYKGRISGNTTPGNGGGVLVYADGEGAGVFTMHNGEISDNEALNDSDWLGGGGVMVLAGGTFTMNGGSILRNSAIVTEAWSAGGGVRVGGVFTMNGGAISYNTSREGAGVSLYAGGVFTMNLGTISRNYTTEQQFASGGGVQIGQGGLFVMHGGTISENTAFLNGGGVSVGWYGGTGGLGGTFVMHGGAISGNIAGSVGGGLNVDAGDVGEVSTLGRFYMRGGTIHGYNAEAHLQNTSQWSMALGGNGLSQFGTFVGGEFNRSGDLPNTNLTIEVIDGVLQGSLDPPQLPTPTDVLFDMAERLAELTVGETDSNVIFEGTPLIRGGGDRHMNLEVVLHNGGNALRINAIESWAGLDIHHYVFGFQAGDLIRVAGTAAADNQMILQLVGAWDWLGSIQVSAGGSFEIEHILTHTNIVRMEHSDQEQPQAVRISGDTANRSFTVTELTVKGTR